MPLCLTFIDLKKAFNSVETEAVAEVLDNQGVPTQCIKVDGRQLNHLLFADDIVLITPSTSQAERMLSEFDETEDHGSSRPARESTLNEIPALVIICTIAIRLLHSCRQTVNANVTTDPTTSHSLAVPNNYRISVG
ncbi:hypothetical protein RB195_004650 [Necator americanus]|uniref:Reverse transcriptase domain-containing protein n=1 Tax=Necator americanus TaxID=51031 RepID=A0ABR1BJ23_NECAM